MARMLSRVARRGLRRGIVDGSRPWLVVGVAAGLLAVARRLTEERPEVVAREVLHPGDTVIVRAHAPEPS